MLVKGWRFRSRFFVDLRVLRSMDATEADRREALPPSRALWELQNALLDNLLRSRLCDIHAQCVGGRLDFTRVSDQDLIDDFSRRIKSGSLLVIRLTRSQYRAAVPSEQEEATAAQQVREQQQPEFCNLKWVRDGFEVAKSRVGYSVTMRADARNVQEGTWVKIKIWEKDKVGSSDLIKVVDATVRNGEVTRDWSVEYHKDADDVESHKEREEKGYTLPEYVFKVEIVRGSKALCAESPLLEVSDEIEIKLRDQRNDRDIANHEYIIVLPDGSTREGTTDSAGYIKEERIPPGRCYLYLKDNSSNSSKI